LAATTTRADLIYACRQSGAAFMRTALAAAW